MIRILSLLTEASKSNHQIRDIFKTSWHCQRMLKEPELLPRDAKKVQILKSLIRCTGFHSRYLNFMDLSDSSIPYYQALEFNKDFCQKQFVS
jgi:hypothetical protein